jgi:hypothetical protein
MFGFGVFRNGIFPETNRTFLSEYVVQQCSGQTLAEFQKSERMHYWEIIGIGKTIGWK